MSSDIKWITNGYSGKYSTMNTKVAMNFSGANSLIDLVVTPPLSHIILGDYTKWCSSLVYFPIDVTKKGNSGFLSVGGADTDVPCFDMSIYHDLGYTLGEYHYTGYYNDFRDYEPYTTVQIYLPFYGFIELPIADIMDKYIQFRLKVDFATGQALYTVGVNDNSVNSPNAPFYIGTDDTYTMILATYSFNIGMTIPLGQTGMVETIRNVALGVVKGAAVVAGAYATVGLGYSGSTTTTKTVKTARNQSTGRQITKGTETKTTTYDGSNYQKGRAVRSAIDVAPDTLSNMSLRPSTDIPNNPFINDQSPRSIYIVRRRCKISDADADYKSHFGVPVGYVFPLNNSHGYTEVSEIHFEGDGFDICTETEMAMIEQAFSDGVILP